MRRILVTGTPGAGKTTIGRLIAARCGLPHVELDALHHGPGWVKRPEFEHEVAAFATSESWVTEDQYHRFLGDLLWEHADLVIWLDLPKRVVMWRLVKRSLLRAVTRTQLWNGNRENWRSWWTPDHPIRWTWENFNRRRQETAARMARHPHVEVRRLQTRAAVR